MPLASAGLVRTDRGEEPRLTEQSCHAATNYQQTPAQTGVSVQLPETSAAVRTPLSSLRGPAADRYRKPPATTTRLLRQGGETEFEISHANEDHIGTTKMHGSSQPRDLLQRFGVACNISATLALSQWLRLEEYHLSHHAHKLLIPTLLLLLPLILLLLKR